MIASAIFAVDIPSVIPRTQNRDIALPYPDSVTQRPSPLCSCRVWKNFILNKSEFASSADKRRGTQKPETAS